MVDSRRMLSPDFAERIRRLAESGVDIAAYAVSSDQLRRVIDETETSAEIKKLVLDFLEQHVIKGRATTNCVELGMAFGEITETREDDGIIAIYNNVRDLDKLPLVIANGKPVQ